MRGELPPDQSKRNAANAVRALNLMPVCAAIKKVVAQIEAGQYSDALCALSEIRPCPSDMVPHPHIVALAEIRNAIRYS